MKIKRRSLVELYTREICLILPPKKRIFSIKPRFDTNIGENYYYLSFPYMFFYIKYVEKNLEKHVLEIKMCFSLDEEGTEIYVPPLMNINGYLNVCLGNNFEKKYNSEKDLIKSILESFWKFQFNSDSTDCYMLYYFDKRKIINYLFWQNMTKENPKWIPTKDLLIENNGFKLLFCENWNIATNYEF